jgi:hypothetical protein
MICTLTLLALGAYIKSKLPELVRIVNGRLGEGEKEEFNVAKTYRNGSTPEPVYADTTCRTKTGSLDRYEVCECLAIVNGVYLVKYRVNGTSAYKTGFVKYSGGVK